MRLSAGPAREFASVRLRTVPSPPPTPCSRQAEAWSLRNELAALQEGQAAQQREVAERYEARLREAEEARAELTSALLSAERAAADGVAAAVERERLLGEIEELREQVGAAHVRQELVREISAALEKSEAAVAQTAQYVAVLEKQVLAARQEAEEARAAAAAARLDAAEALVRSGPRTAQRATRAPEMPESLLAPLLTGSRPGFFTVSCSQSAQAEELTAARTALESSDPKDWPVAAQAALAVQAEARAAAERAVEEVERRARSAAAEAERSAEAAESAAAAAEARRRVDMQSFARRCSALEADLTVKDELIRLHVASIAALEAKCKELDRDAALWNAHRTQRVRRHSKAPQGES